MSRSLLRCTFVVTCIAMSSSVARAQSDSTERSTARSTDAGAIAPVAEMAAIAAHRAGPTIAPPSFALTPIDPLRAAAQADADLAAVVPRRAPFSRPAVLMITGGALLVTGLLVDGDASSILIIAGAGIGGYGLYLHLQSPNARLRR